MKRINVLIALLISCFTQVYAQEGLEILLNGQKLNRDTIISDEIETMKFSFAYEEKVRNYDKVVFCIETKEAYLRRYEKSADIYMSEREDFDPLTMILSKECKSDKANELCLGDLAHKIFYKNKAENGDLITISYRGLKITGYEQKWNEYSKSYISSPIYGDGKTFAKREIVVKPNAIRARQAKRRRIIGMAVGLPLAIMFFVFL
ncbi:MAG: hypothetical protein EP338_04025 [Bacteroidetes bacterium]|nr:MAG: hypothetical protein EP338_04025 [Bacteroidota bacterium]